MQSQLKQILGGDDKKLDMLMEGTGITVQDKEKWGDERIN